MPKFDINSSRYAGFFESRDAANALRYLINNPDIIQMNYGFWRTRFSPPSGTIARGNDGRALFSARLRTPDAPHMLDLRAPLGDSRPRDTSGIEFYTGTIPDFIAPGYVETAMEREDKQRILDEYFGDDSELVAILATNIQTMINEGNQTMNNMAAQVMSTGQITYSYGQGAQSPITKVPIPAENFMGVGELAWTDNSALILNDMQNIEQLWRDRFGLGSQLVWDIPIDIFQNIFLHNNQIKEYILAWREINEKVNVNGMNIIPSMFEEAFRANNVFFSSIQLVTEMQSDNGTTVHGWKDGIVTLRPAGFVGSIKKANLLDRLLSEKYGSSVIAKVFADVDIFTVVNTTLNNGYYKEWHTDMMVSALPVLEEWPYHFIINTNSPKSSGGGGRTMRGSKKPVIE